MKINILDILNRDDLQQQEQHKADNVGKEDMLRAGNCGLMLPDGNHTGACTRKSYLRLKGIDLEAEANRLVMFEFGRQNEAIIIDKLHRQLGDTMLITGDDVNTISWQLPSGRTVSGRPDVVIANKSKEPVLLLEMKLICSVWTARSVVFGNEPKMGHIIQAMHYAMKLGVPCKLVYVQAVDFSVPGWGMNDLPTEGQVNSEFIEYSDKIDKKTQTKIRSPKKLLPCRVVYDLELDATGCVRYRREESKLRWTVTPVTMEGITQFYEAVDDMATGKTGLGARPISLKACGDFENYTLCQYCELNPICDRLEKQPDKWLEAVKEAVSAGLVKS